MSFRPDHQITAPNVNPYDQPYAPKSASEHVARFSPSRVAQRRSALKEWALPVAGGSAFVLFVLVIGSPLLAGFTG